MRAKRLTWSIRIFPCGLLRLLYWLSIKLWDTAVVTANITVSKIRLWASARFSTHRKRLPAELVHFHMLGTTEQFVDSIVHSCHPLRKRLWHFSGATLCMCENLPHCSLSVVLVYEMYFSIKKLESLMIGLFGQSDVANTKVKWMITIWVRFDISTKGSHPACDVYHNSHHYHSI